MPTVKAVLKKILTVRSLVAIALMFWCAGAGCMMVSYARTAATEVDAAPPAADHAMHMSASMDAHECCKAKHKNEKRARSVKLASDSEFAEFTIPASTPSDAMSCCPLTTGSIVVASRSQSNDSAPALAPADSSLLKLSKSNSKPVAVPLRLPNRAQAYLLDCAFLI